MRAKIIGTLCSAIAAVCLMDVPGRAVAASYNWTGTAGSNWGNAANWNDTIPDAAGIVAIFSDATGTGATVDLGTNDGTPTGLAVDRTVGGVTFNANVANINIAAATNATKKLILDNGSSSVLVDVQGGTHTISAPVQLKPASNTISAAANSSLTLSGPVTTPGGSTTSLEKSGPGVLNVTGQVFKPTDANTSLRQVKAHAGTLNLANTNVYSTAFFTGDGGANSNVTATNTAIVCDGENDWGALVVGYNANQTACYDMHGGSLKTYWGGVVMAASGGGVKAILTLDNNASLELKGSTADPTDSYSYSEFRMGDGGSGGSTQVVMRDGTMNFSPKSFLRVGVSTDFNVFNQLGGSVYHPKNTGTTSYNGTPAALTLQYRMNKADNYGIFNLNGGTLTTGAIISGDGTQGDGPTPSVANNAYFNFHGGTLSPAGSDSNFIRTTITGPLAPIAAPHVIVYSEGAVLDITAGNDITIQQPLAAPASQGVYAADGSITVPVPLANQGAGYRATPLILVNDPGVTGISGTTSTGSNVITGLSSTANILVGQRIEGSNLPNGTFVTSVDPGTSTITVSRNATGDGTPGFTFKGQAATAVANMVDDGSGALKVASITITNPGIGYALTPTVSMSGGDPSTPAVLPALATAANVSGGLIKKGNFSTLTLTGVNTYAGDTTISGGTLVIGGAGQLGGGSYAGNISIANVGNALTINSTANQTLSGVISDDGKLHKDNSGTLTLSNANTYTGGTTVNGGTVALAHADALPVDKDLTINTAATVREIGNLGNAVQLSTLSINGTGKFDLAGGKLVVEGYFTPESVVRAHIAAGRNGGTWNGTGITSSWASADPVAYAVGYLSNSDLGSEWAYTVGSNPEAPAAWFGRTATTDSVFVRLTYAGDADMTGDVSTDDFDLWKYGYAESLPATWYNGDFDYSGGIDTDDFDLWKYAYSFSYPALDHPGAAAVPEPATIALLTIGLLAAGLRFAPIRSRR